MNQSNNEFKDKVQGLINGDSKSHLYLSEGEQSQVAISALINGAQDAITALISVDDLSNWTNEQWRRLLAKRSIVNKTVILVSHTAREKISPEIVTELDGALQLIPAYAPEIRPFLVVDGKNQRVGKEGERSAFICINDPNFGAILNDIGVILTSSK